MSDSQIEKMISVVFKFWKDKDIVTFKEKEDAVLQRAAQFIRLEFDKERQIEDEANRMVEQLDAQQPGLERHKLFLGIKKRLAKERKVVL